MRSQIRKNRTILNNKYINKRPTKVQVKRVENYSEVLLRSLEQYATEIESVVLGYNKKAVDKTMGLLLLRTSSRNTQNRKNHQDMVEGISVEVARKLGLNEGVTRIMARNHDINHTFFGHMGEIWLSNIKSEYGLGVYTHSSLGPKELIYRQEIFDEIISRISSFNPQIQEKELNRIKKGLWLIFDGINSHNGELSDVEIRPNTNKTQADFEEEIMMSHVEEGFDRTIMPATMEGSLIRMCDKAAYAPFDMIDRNI